MSTPRTARDVIAWLFYDTAWFSDGSSFQETTECAVAILSALSAEGWVVVSREPTDSMVETFMHRHEEHNATPLWSVAVRDGLRAALHQGEAK